MKIDCNISYASFQTRRIVFVWGFLVSVTQICLQVPSRDARRHFYLSSYEHLWALRKLLFQHISVRVTEEQGGGVKRERERESERGREFGCGLFSACYVSTLAAGCFLIHSSLMIEAGDEAGRLVMKQETRWNTRQEGRI